MRILPEILLITAGLSLGFFIASGLVALVIGLGIVTRYAGITKTAETSKVGTRIDIPVNLPFNSGITLPTALAAPVDEGIMLPEAARPPLQSFIEGPSTVF